MEQWNWKQNDEVRKIHTREVISKLKTSWARAERPTEETLWISIESSSVVGFHHSSLWEDENRRRSRRKDRKKTRDDGSDTIRTERVVDCGGFRSFFWGRRQEQTEYTPSGQRESSIVVDFDPSSGGESTTKRRRAVRTEGAVVGAGCRSIFSRRIWRRLNRESRRSSSVSIIRMWRSKQEETKRREKKKKLKILWGWQVVQNPRLKSVVKVPH